MVPPRQLGLLSATALVVASMVGSGVFTTSGFLLADLHTPGRVLGAWAGGGVLAFLGALCYGALGRRFPESGGEYLYLSRTLHPAAGYLAGWISLLAGFSAPLAAVALAFGAYLKDWLPGWPPQLTGSVLLVGCATLHGLHIQRGAWTQNLAVLLNLLLLGGLVGLSCARLEPVAAAAAAPSGFPVGAFAVALVWVSFSYSGWNAAAYLGGEIREPGRNLPRAMAAGTVVVTLLYLGLNAVFVFAAPVESLAGKLEVARLAAQALGGAALANAVTGLMALALATCASSMLMAGPRVYARMAEDGYLPAWLRSVGPGPPRRSILLQAVLALALLWTATFTGLLTYIGFTLGLSTAGAVAGLVRARLREGPALAVPGWPWVPGIFLVAIAAITGFTIAREPRASAVGLATLLAGAAAWRLAYGTPRQGGLGCRQ
jgi:APA family basic amino acid/polyamine antiporter